METMINSARWPGVLPHGCPGNKLTTGEWELAGDKCCLDIKVGLKPSIRKASGRSRYLRATEQSGSLFSLPTQLSYPAWCQAYRPPWNILLLLSWGFFLDNRNIQCVPTFVPLLPQWIIYIYKFTLIKVCQVNYSDCKESYLDIKCASTFRFSNTYYVHINV